MNGVHAVSTRLAGITSVLVLASAFAAQGQTPDGFGGRATGGGNATPITVTSPAALASAVGGTNAAVVVVQGTIDLGPSGSVAVGSNKTIMGANTSATILGTLKLNQSQNVIIKYLNISANTGEPGSNDGISVDFSRDIFITRCTIFNCTDGNLDIAKGSEYVTVSWCKFYYTRDNDHNFSNLIGSSDTDNDTSSYRITFHHNWWGQGCKQRMPADRFGTPFHLYNNYWSCSGNSYCSTARNITQMLAEGNVYEGVNSPLAREQNARLKTNDNMFINCTGTMATNNDSVPSPISVMPDYRASVGPASGVKAMVTNPTTGAGNVPQSGTPTPRATATPTARPTATPTPTATVRPRPTPTSGGGPATYQAEAATVRNNVVVESQHGGYLGSGYVNFPASGSTGYIEFQGVSGLTGGTRTIAIRYALGATAARSGTLTVNGQTSSITFNPTGAWTTWQTLNVSRPLNSGSGNTVRITSTTDLSNVDQVTIQ